MNPDRTFWGGRRVLVTGHTGFKGAWLSLWLKELGAQVIGFARAPDMVPNLFEAALVAPSITDRVGDVRDLDALRGCFEEERPSIVLHLAAQSLVGASYVDPVGTYATNIMGTVNLLEAVRCCPSVEAVVVVTSDKAYQNREWVWAYREHESMGGHDPYSSSKGCAELVTAAYRTSFFGTDELTKHCARVASARAGNVVGGGDWSHGRLVPDAIRAFSRGEAVRIRAPASIRPWQHVLEPLAGYLLLAERLAGLEGPSFAEGWNFGPADEDCRSVGEVVAALGRQWGQGAEWCLATEPHPHEAIMLKVDASKARARLPWDRRLQFADTIAMTCEWYRAQAAGIDAGDLCRDQIAHYEALAGGSE